MELQLIADKKFEKISNLEFAEYDACIFMHCDFSNTVFSNFKFINCKFIACNLSLAKLKNSSFQHSTFKDCKMLGLRFDECNNFLLSFAFENCQLDHSSFFRVKIRKTIFTNCSLKEIDLSESDLTESKLINCDLSGAIFENTILEKADLRNAYNYSIDPVSNRIKKAKFSLNGLSGLLDRYDIEID